MNAHSTYREAGPSRLSHDRDTAFASMEENNHHQNHFMDEETAAAAAAVASVRAAQYAEYTQHISPLQEVASQADSETNGKIKRARSTAKITRNRKITSCLQCRERKQKVGTSPCKEGDRLADMLFMPVSATARSHCVGIVTWEVPEVVDSALMSTLWKKRRKSWQMKGRRMQSKSSVGFRGSDDSSFSD